MTGTSITDGQTHDHGTIAHLDPATVTIGDNVRDLATLTEAFVSSVREHVVLQPITALRDTTTGQVIVLDGQLRTLAAREAGLATIPVYLRDNRTADTNVAVAARAAHQIVTNDQRSALTDAQRARGIQQMLDAGVTATKVAKRHAVPKDAVAAARTVTGSTRAMDALNDGQLSLAEARANPHPGTGSGGTGGTNAERRLAQRRYHPGGQRSLGAVGHPGGLAEVPGNQRLHPRPHRAGRRGDPVGRRTLRPRQH